MHVALFPGGTTMDNVVMKHLPIISWCNVCLLGICLGAAFLGQMTCMCQLHRKCQCFQNDHASLHFCHQCMRVSVALYSWWHLVSSVFLTLAILVEMEQSHVVVLIFIPLMIDDIKYILLHLLAIWISSLVKYLFQVFCPFLYWVYLFFAYMCRSLRYQFRIQIFCLLCKLEIFFSSLWLAVSLL